MKQKLTLRSVLVALGCALLLFVNTGVAQTTGYSFFVPIAASLNVNMGLISYSITISSISMMIFCLFYGKLLKRFSLRWLMLFFGILMGGSWLLQAAAQNIIVLYVAFAIRGAASLFCANMITSIILLNWFKHNTVMAVINTMDNLAPALLSFPVAAAVEIYGWRPIGNIIGVASIVVTAAAALFLIRLTPQECGQQAVGSVIGQTEEKPDPGKLPGIAAKDALKMPKFYLMILIAACMLFLAQGMSAHRIAIIMSMDLTYVQAGAAVSLTSLFAVIFQICFGALSDKFGLRASTLFAGVFYIAAMLIGLFAPSGILGWGIAYGVFTSTMANSSIYPSLASKELFGLKDLATLSGYAQTAALVGGIIGSALIGTVYAATENYNIVLIVAMIPAIITVLAGLFNHRKANWAAQA